MIILVIDNAAYRLVWGNVHQAAYAVGTNLNALWHSPQAWTRLDPTQVGNKQMAQLVHIKAALETAETSQL